MIQGIGNNHNLDTHRVTDCIHDHSMEKKSGGASLSPVSPAGQKCTKQLLDNSGVTEGLFSLITRVKNTLTSGKKMLLRIWGENAEASAMEGMPEGDTNAAGDTLADIYNAANITLADSQSKSGRQDAARQSAEIEMGAMMQTPQTIMQNNPYFVPAPEKKRENLLQRVRVRFQTITKYFTNQFSGRNSFETKKDRPREDLRRHSRYRQDDMEINCVITDDSYLLDSYDKRGEYSRLSVKK